MITVSISINGGVIYTRSALNRTPIILSKEETSRIPNTYVIDDGTKIKHVPNDGSVKLAIKMLKKIKELK